MLSTHDLKFQVNRHHGTIAVDGSLVQTYIFRCVLVSRLFIYRFHRNIPSGKDFICKKCYDYHHSQMSTTGDVINMCNRVVNFFQPLMPNSCHFTTKRLKNAKNIAQVKQLSYGIIIIIFIFLHKHNKNHRK